MNTTAIIIETPTVGTDRRTSNITYAEVQDALQRAWNSNDKTPEGFAAWRAYQGIWNDYQQQEMRKHLPEMIDREKAVSRHWEGLHEVRITIPLQAASSREQCDPGKSIFLFDVQKESAL